MALFSLLGGIIQIDESTGLDEVQRSEANNFHMKLCEDNSSIFLEKSRAYPCVCRY
jgi:hypothetical protein